MLRAVAIAVRGLGWEVVQQAPLQAHLPLNSQSNPSQPPANPRPLQNVHVLALTQTALCQGRCHRLVSAVGIWGCQEAAYSTAQEALAAQFCGSALSLFSNSWPVGVQIALHTGQQL